MKLFPGYYTIKEWDDSKSVIKIASETINSLFLPSESSISKTPSWVRIPVEYVDGLKVKVSLEFLAKSIVQFHGPCHVIG
jgi:NADPH-dependent 7-cyano-7-deazaguanine reductase QueF